MRAWTVRRLICPLHERLLGRRTLRNLRELERSQWLSPDDLRALQRAKLAALLGHAAVNTAFYRERLAQAAADLGDGDPFEVLDRIPPIEKSDIRTHLESLLWREAPGGLFPQSTGGSTGEPLTIYLDRRRQGYDQAARLRSQGWFGARLGDAQLYLWGSPLELRSTDRIRAVRDRLFNHLLLDAFNMSPRRLDAYLDAWDRFRPVSVYGYPSSLALFAQHARGRRRALDTSRLRAVFVTGEVCYPHDREAIGSYFGVPVADGYGSRDAGFIAHECPEGGSHITAENVIVEILRNGRRQPPGEAGEIVVTHLDAYGLPLIRYGTGDIGRLRAGRCACGRGLPLMDVVQGRSTDFLYLPDGTVKHALSIIYPLREMSAVRRFRVTQSEDLAVTVEVVCERGIDGTSQEAVARRVRGVLGGDVPLRVRLVDEVTVAPSGKFRYVTSAASPGAAVAKEARPTYV
jgi:phenylacetate-CoA ligase